jgi:regulator of protease activity HflC (stomatin/prohibitin superfamily)
METKQSCAVTSVITATVLLILVLIMAFYTVPAGYVGVVTRFGAVDYVAYPGLGMRWPIINAIHRMSVQTQKDQIDVGAASQDLQAVSATIAVNYHLDGSKAVVVYQDIGVKYADIIIAPAIQNTFKAVTAQYTAEQLIKSREEVRIKAEKSLQEQLTAYHIIVENFNITNFDFSPEYNAAIEAKQVAQQAVETAKQKLAQAQVDAQTVQAAAQGQADAQKALKNTGALSPEYLEYMFLQKWNGIMPLYYGGDLPVFTLPAPTGTK